MRFFRLYPKDAEPQKLLDPDQQFSTPWGSPDGGSCDKCRGTGSVGYECRSCIAEGGRGECPACQGRVRFDEICPVCEGSGEITRTRRRGVAVFPTLGGLKLYLTEKGVDLDGEVVVELEGALSDDRDLDADAGALLVHPTHIVAVQPAADALQLRFASLRGAHSGRPPRAAGSESLSHPNPPKDWRGG